jgi:hypothetical protein
MRTTTYKYNIGDVVEFKSEHHFWADVMGTKVLITEAEIVDRRDYDGPCYALGGCTGFYKEACIAGIKTNN